MKLFRDTIELIEPTKLLERHQCDSITSTNYLLRNFLSDAVLIKPIIGGTGVEHLDYSRLQYYNKYVLTSILSVLNIKDSVPLVFTFPTLVTHSRDPFATLTTPTRSIRINNEGADIQLNEIGNYSLIFDFSLTVTTLGGVYNVKPTLTYNFEVIETGIILEPQHTITQVLERILEIHETRREGIDEQQYILDSEIAAKYSDVKAPEFYITRKTLFEALLEVGKYIHAMPRLKWPNIITFDEFGGSEEYTLPPYAKLVSYQSTYNMDEYCGEIDSIVENMINTRNASGSITEPCIDGWQTTRTDIGNVIISNDTAEINLKREAQKIDKVEVGFINATQPEVGEISEFVYEDAEYQTLSSTNSTYPYSKAYALKYNQGGTAITGLSFKIDSLTGAFRSPALDNIIKSKNSTFSLPYSRVAFRVTYVPIVTARVKQKKAVTGFPSKNTLISNQSANLVESEFIGENMKGIVARLGNQVEVFTYHFKRLRDIPKIGQLWEDKYVCIVEKEFNLNYIKATITTTKDYNKLAEFLGLDSNIRYYDVSEKQSVNRYSNYSETVIIGDEEENNPDHAGITAAGVTLFSKVFDQSTPQNTEASCALLQTLTKDKEVLPDPSNPKALMLPCISDAHGSSLFFNFGFKDNYSAGLQSAYLDANRRIQQPVPYCNTLGEFYYLSATIANKLERTWSFNDQNATSGLAHALPVIQASDINAGYFDFRKYPFIYRKDNREIPDITYQLHFQANREEIVIGALLAQLNPLITDADSTRAAKLYLLPNKINSLRNTIDLAGAFLLNTSVSSLISVDTANKKIQIGSFTNTFSVDFKSWAFVDDTTGAFYIGENIDLPSGAESKPITLAFKGGNL